MPPIIVNGQSYDTWAQVPPELRQQLAGLPDTDGNGVPDVFEGNLAGLLDGAGDSGHRTFTSTTSVEIDGQHYDSLEQVPQPLRDQISRAVAGPVATGSERPTPAVAPSAAPVPAPAPEQVLLNGEPVAVDRATDAQARKGFLSRLFGR